MTYVKNCLNCECYEFECSITNSWDASLNKAGGIHFTNGQLVNLIPDNPKQITCQGCGLSVERERLHPGYDQDAFLAGEELKILIHD